MIPFQGQPFGTVQPIDVHFLEEYHTLNPTFTSLPVALYVGLRAPGLFLIQFVTFVGIILI